MGTNSPGISIKKSSLQYDVQSQQPGQFNGLSRGNGDVFQAVEAPCGSLDITGGEIKASDLSPGEVTAGEIAVIYLCLLALAPGKGAAGEVGVGNTAVFQGTARHKRARYCWEQRVPRAAG